MVQVVAIKKAVEYEAISKCNDHNEKEGVRLQELAVKRSGPSIVYMKNITTPQYDLLVAFISKEYEQFLSP